MNWPLSGARPCSGGGTGAGPQALGCSRQKGSSTVAHGLGRVANWVPQLLPGAHFQGLRVSRSLALGVSCPDSFEGSGGGQRDEGTEFQRRAAQANPASNLAPPLVASPLGGCRTASPSWSTSSGRQRRSGRGKHAGPLTPAPFLVPDSVEGRGMGAQSQQHHHPEGWPRGLPVPWSQGEAAFLSVGVTPSAGS